MLRSVTKYADLAVSGKALLNTVTTDMALVVADVKSVAKKPTNTALRKKLNADISPLATANHLRGRVELQTQPRSQSPTPLISPWVKLPPWTGRMNRRCRTSTPRNPRSVTA